MPGPSHLWVVRHGESAGNVAWREADASGSELIDVGERDADVPLSPLGERQARAVGVWLATSRARPTHVFSSSYERARATAHAIVDSAKLDTRVVTDERLREKELGLLNRLTRAGIAARMPEEVERRRALGKFYYRPPNGESWCDVLLRIRSFWRDEIRDLDGANVLVVGHSVVTLCLRYLLDELDEKQLLAIDSSELIANCSVTRYALHDGRLRLAEVNSTAALIAAGLAVTHADDARTK